MFVDVAGIHQREKAAVNFVVGATHCRNFPQWEPERRRNGNAPVLLKEKKYSLLFY